MKSNTINNCGNYPPVGGQATDDLLDNPPVVGQVFLASFVLGCNNEERIKKFKDYNNCYPNYNKMVWQLYIKNRQYSFKNS